MENSCPRSKKWQLGPKLQNSHGGKDKWSYSLSLSTLSITRGISNGDLTFVCACGTSRFMTSSFVVNVYVPLHLKEGNQISKPIVQFICIKSTIKYGFHLGIYLERIDYAQYQ
jgi:hypothetical protein